MITAIHSFINQHKLIPPGATVIIGLSGGPDSVFLLHLLAPWAHEGKIKLIAAHLDHGWRANSHTDLIFCEQLCAQLNILFIGKHANDLTLNVKYNGSKEEVGRKLRRHFFEMVAKERHADIIALAHHAQDQQETFFLRLLRGTTLTGLTSIKPKHGIYVRPLLHTNKADIISYLHAHGISYLEDPTNKSPEFLRNRIRATILPALSATDPRFNNTFSATITALQETELFLDELTQETLITVAPYNIIDLKKWAALHPLLQKKVVVLWLYNHKLPLQLTASFIEEISRFFLSSNGGTHLLHPTWALVKKQGNVKITMLPS